MAKQRRKYTEEFKRDAVHLMLKRGERTVAQIADDLGVATNQLHRWAAQYEQEAVAKRNEKAETLETKPGGSGLLFVQLLLGSFQVSIDVARLLTLRRRVRPALTIPREVDPCSATVGPCFRLFTSAGVVAPMPNPARTLFMVALLENDNGDRESSMLVTARASDHQLILG